MSIIVNTEILVPFLVGTIFGVVTVNFVGFMNRLEKRFEKDL